ncbi:Ty3/gypsy retrotransposon protein [Sesbania bispinosa]|nr:Ty3/gypsy retrotransposon protein [Sesbania bispinosa]
MAERREKGLCFNCYQKYSRNHRCGAKLMLLVAEEKDIEADEHLGIQLLDPPAQPTLVDVEAQPAQLSLHALSGDGAPETIRVAGVVLGAQWLKQFGPVLMDYQQLTVKFVRGQDVIELKGETSPQPPSISLHQLKRIIQGDKEAQFFSLQVVGPEPVLSVPKFVFLEELKQELALTPEFLDLRDKCLHDSPSFPEFKVVDDLLLYKGKIWLNSDSKFKPLLLREFHETQLPLTSVDNNPVITPLAILAFKTTIVDHQPVRFALVQWSGLSPDDTSWENWDELQSVYNLEDKVALDEGGIVRNETNVEPNNPCIG